jgi:hypothetical protein
LLFSHERSHRINNVYDLFVGFLTAGNTLGYCTIEERIETNASIAISPRILFIQVVSPPYILFRSSIPT